MTADIVYKIVTDALWQEARESGVFHGAPVDLADGFIHFSTVSQVRRTAELHFGGQRDLLLIGVDAARLAPQLRFEPSRGGDLFPHLYGPLPLSAVLFEASLPLGSDGRHVFPENIA